MSSVAAILMLACCVGSPAESSDPMVRASVPADGKMTLTDYGSRDWGPELVEYTIDTMQFKPGQVVLVDAQGAWVPHQINGDVLSFVASVRNGCSAKYTLRPKDADIQGQSRLSAGVQGQNFVIRNELLALQVPAPAAKSHTPAIEAPRATPPILQWAGADGAWMGGTRFVTSRRVAAEAFRVVRQGSAVVAARTRGGAKAARRGFRWNCQPGPRVADHAVHPRPGRCWRPLHSAPDPLGKQHGREQPAGKAAAHPAVDWEKIRGDCHPDYKSSGQRGRLLQETPPGHDAPP